MQQLLVATGNPGKLIEIEALLVNVPVSLVLPQQIGLSLVVEENGNSYEENACLKAGAFAEASGLITLADDSGLEVDVLGGLPGLHSARFSPLPHANDADRRQRLLGMLSAHPRPWKAHFHCTVAIAVPRGRTYYAQGNCPGEIITEERGSHGFGYDPIFLLAGTGMTMAQLTMDQKNQLSHRARAVRAALPILAAVFR